MASRKRASPAPPEIERAAAEAVAREQARIAQALHDTVCQSLSGIHLMSRLLARKVEARCPELAPEMKELAGLLEQAAGELHALSQQLAGPKAGAE